jgi:hypothetical protein
MGFWRKRSTPQSKDPTKLLADANCAQLASGMPPKPQSQDVNVSQPRKPSLDMDKVDAPGAPAAAPQRRRTVSWDLAQETGEGSLDKLKSSPFGEQQRSLSKTNYGEARGGPGMERSYSEKSFFSRVTTRRKSSAKGLGMSRRFSEALAAAQSASMQRMRGSLLWGERSLNLNEPSKVVRHKRFSKALHQAEQDRAESGREEFSASDTLGAHYRHGSLTGDGGWAAASGGTHVR